MWRLEVYGRNRPSKASDMAITPCCLLQQESVFRYFCFILSTFIISSTVRHYTPVSTTSIFKLSSSVALVTSVRASCSWGLGRWGPWRVSTPKQAGPVLALARSRAASPQASLGTALSLGVRHLPEDGDRMRLVAIGPMDGLCLATVWSWRLVAARTDSSGGAEMGPAPWAGWGRHQETGQGQGGLSVSSALMIRRKAALPHVTATCNLLFSQFFQLFQICGYFFCDGHGQIPTGKSDLSPSVDAFQAVKRIRYPQRKDHSVFFITYLWNSGIEESPCTSHAKPHS